MNYLEKSFYGITVEFASDIRYHDHEAADIFEEHLVHIIRILDKQHLDLNNHIFVAPIAKPYYLSLCRHNGKNYFKIIKSNNIMKGHCIEINPLKRNLLISLLPQMNGFTESFVNRVNGYFKYNNSWSINERIVNMYLNDFDKEYTYEQDQEIDKE